MLGGRYRVVGLLGRGGMGEVYRADDLKLGQAVALKFLPAMVEKDQVLLQRFLNEVKIARQISHPNVCRVYDVGEVDGHHYLSMEYVDGEDLASLLRRIGRLPKDKAVQISRQLCMGLAAAHEQGILHRDLKPANVMIDGRGRARITDFGLATLAGSVRQEDVGAGTPSYMAPEQRAGKDVTVRSDLYALGLVLYELFTGQQAFKASTPAELARLQEESAPTSPTRLVEGLDPAVERAILRCLAKEPRDRPASAIAVAASLPGGDPLAAARAAGETPSPEMVADAGGTGVLRPLTALACVVTILLGLGLQVWWVRKNNLLWLVPLEKPPEVLVADARSTLADLGYPERPADHEHGFRYRFGWYMGWLKRRDDSRELLDRIRSARPSPVVFWYRQSPGFLEPVLPGWQVGPEDPPVHAPGDATVTLDLAGRLLELEVGVPEVDPEGDPPSGEPDASKLLARAGIDASLLRAARPGFAPPVSCDHRLAWYGTYPDQPGVEMGFEAGFHRGRPVWFRVFPPEEKPRAAATVAGVPVLEGLYIGLMFLAFGSGLLLARRNLRLGRGDRTGAFRIAALVFTCTVVGRALNGHHVPVPSEATKFQEALAWALLFAGLVYIGYLGLEPYVRRLWPDALVSWSRLLAGRFRDPLVGRDLLFGGVAAALPGIAFSLIAKPNPRVLSSTEQLRGAVATLGEIAGNLLPDAVVIAIGVLLLALVVRVVLRKSWAVLLAFTALGAALGAGSVSGDPIRATILGMMMCGLAAVVLLRFGLLALISVIVTSQISQHALPAILPWSSWHASSGLLGLVILLAIVGYAFVISLGGRPIFRGSILPE